ncbi:hypothetical protein EXIGLDRAFT_783078 [Exidia glandulosa HHB12029]|uniref:F-box domain-containing protein n=1 Tax=Exidia glandulosa HHB12029 TaxID=1314781 RepID=A0A166N9W8_EXIGL|nr:hypothetical protein EXIGLDRAFT_783078 [Exidia glandulosa HHB12029]
MFDELPIELVYHILELAAQLAQTDAHAWVATSLALVSREVHQLILPTIYHTVLLDGHRGMMLSADAFEPPPHVRHTRCLMLRGFGLLHSQLLTFFPGVDTFAVDFYGLRLLDQVDDFCPERLMYLSDTWYDMFSAIANPFRNLTHLRLNYETISLNQPQFPRLTNLFVEHRVYGNDTEVFDISVASMLSLPRLQRVVFRFYHLDCNRIAFGNRLASLRALKDPRVYLDHVPVGRTMPLDTGLWCMFTACASEVRTGVDVWETGIPLLLYPGNSSSDSG